MFALRSASHVSLFDPTHVTTADDELIRRFAGVVHTEVASAFERSTAKPLTEVAASPATVSATLSQLQLLESVSDVGMPLDSAGGSPGRGRGGAGVRSDAGGGGAGGEAVFSWTGPNTEEADTLRARHWLVDRLNGTENSGTPPDEAKGEEVEVRDETADVVGRLFVLDVHSEPLFDTTLGDLKLRGRTDLLVKSEYDSINAILGVVELKTDASMAANADKHRRQTELELLCCCRISAFAPFALLTDLRNHWEFFHIEDTEATPRKVICQQFGPRGLDNLRDVLADAERVVARTADTFAAPPRGRL